MLTVKYILEKLKNSDVQGIFWWIVCVSPSPTKKIGETIFSKQYNWKVLVFIPLRAKQVEGSKFNWKKTQHTHKYGVEEFVTLAVCMSLVKHLNHVLANYNSVLHNLSKLTVVLSRKMHNQTITLKNIYFWLVKLITFLCKIIVLTYHVNNLHSFINICKYIGHFLAK